MATYVLTWKPTNWKWSNFEECIAKSTRGEIVKEPWSCGNRKNVEIGDRVFLLRQGPDRPGLIGSGTVTRGSYSAPHWDKVRRLRRKKALYVDVDWDELRALENRIPRRELLLQEYLPARTVNAQAGGVIVDAETAAKLEEIWTPKGRRLSVPAIAITFGAWEAEPIEHTTYRRGRDRRLRNEAMAMSQGVCVVCEVDYSEILDGAGIRVLQVHHVDQLGYRDRPKLTKLSDLAVVCANCHLLIHLNPKKAQAISELRLKLTPE